MIKRTILLVDHDARAGEALASRLGALGFNVAGLATTRAEALERATQAAPDLVLMDVAVDELDDALIEGDQLRHVAEVPLLFMASAENEPVLRAAGFDDPSSYLLIPFTDRELALTIELSVCKQNMIREARRLEDRFFALSVDMLCFLDFSGHFKRLNPAWERTLGFTLDELMSRPFIEFVHPDDRERTLNQNREVRGGGRALGFENRYLCKDGSYRWFLWNAAPDTAGQVIYSVARDITARKQVEEERERLVRELTAALSEVKQLQEILPICSYCKKIRDDENYWQSVEGYFARHTNTRFSHGICPGCMESVVRPQLDQFEREQ